MEHHPPFSPLKDKKDMYLIATPITSVIHEII